MATIKDIAKKTGFSIMTVSRVINEPEKVKKKTRDIILKTMKENDFSVNTVAQSLVRRKTKIIYMFLPKGLSSKYYFVKNLVVGVCFGLGQKGYSLMLKNEIYTNEACDGIVTTDISRYLDNDLKSFIDKKPIVFFGNSNEYKNWIDVDNYYGSKIMTEYLISKGHKKIAFIGIDQNNKFVKERFNGFIDVMNEKNLEVNQNQIIYKPNDNKGGYNACKEILKSGKPNAIFCSSDVMAEGCIRALHSEGYLVPNDVAVSGYDGIGLEKMVVPNITTIEQPIYEIGISLANRIVELIETGEDKEGILIKPNLIINQSA